VRQYRINIREKSGRGRPLKVIFLANMSHEIVPYERYFRVYSPSKKPKLTGDEQQQYISVIEKNA
jgi:hypothetical protein